MNFYGLILGVMAFLIIGVFHPIVIKLEYYVGKKAWPVFLVGGLVFIVVSLMVGDKILSAFFGVLGFSCLWSIHEIIEQEERVRKGWFPANPRKARKED